MLEPCPVCKRFSTRFGMKLEFKLFSSKTKDDYLEKELNDILEKFFSNENNKKLCIDCWCDSYNRRLWMLVGFFLGASSEKRRK